jgi:uncharacterized protein YeaO (DUF488 family)
MFALKRAYEPASPRDGVRILVERLWPRGLTKRALRLDEWRKDVAPSVALRTWFGHDPHRWVEFKRRYARELRRHPEAWRPLVALGGRRRVTLVYAAHDTKHNSAVALAAFLRSRRRRPTR